MPCINLGVYHAATESVQIFNRERIRSHTLKRLGLRKGDSALGRAIASMCRQRQLHNLEEAIADAQIVITVPDRSCKWKLVQFGPVAIEMPREINYCTTGKVASPPL